MAYFLCDVFLMFFFDKFKSDCILWTMFLSKSDAVQNVWQAFEKYVTV